MQLKGGKQVTLTPGQAFYEGPDDVHVVDRNASRTKPAKFLVVLIKNKGAPALVPAESLLGMGAGRGTKSLSDPEGSRRLTQLVIAPELTALVAVAGY